MEEVSEEDTLVIPKSSVEKDNLPPREETEEEESRQVPATQVEAQRTRPTNVCKIRDDYRWQKETGAYQTSHKGNPDLEGDPHTAAGQT